MDGSHSLKEGSKVLEIKPDAQPSKRRKVVEKKVVTVRIAANAGNLKNEGPPSDSWSWRKYGQKHIKGSPYPRGYYRCSTSKGCSAKKRVERCRTDSSMLVITYTSSHNHPCPNFPNLNPNEHKESQDQPNEDHHPNSLPDEEHSLEKDLKQDQPFMKFSDKLASEGQNNEFHYLQFPFGSSQDIMITYEDPFIENPEKAQEALSILLDDVPIHCNEEVTLSATPKSEENGFFDELEELPMSSTFPTKGFLLSLLDPSAFLGCP